MTDLMLHTQIQGYWELQRARVQLLEAINPQGGLGQAVKEAALLLHRYAVDITHRHTGTLAASHMIDFASGGLETNRYHIRFKSSAAALIYINPLTVNPYSGERPSEYGLLEHARGGSHAFYKRTYEEMGPWALTLAHNIIWGRLPKGGVVGIRGSAAPHVLGVMEEIASNI